MEQRRPTRKKPSASRKAKAQLTSLPSQSLHELGASEPSGEVKLPVVIKYLPPPPAPMVPLKPTQEPPTLQLLLTLARKPLVRVIVLGAYWTVSVSLLIEKLSALKITNAALATFVLIWGIVEHFDEFKECLGCISHQIGRLFIRAGMRLRHSGRRSKS